MSLSGLTLPQHEVLIYKLLGMRLQKFIFILLEVGNTSFRISCNAQKSQYVVETVKANDTNMFRGEVCSTHIVNHRLGKYHEK